MKKNRIKSVILAVLLIVAILSLAGCVKLQKKAPAKDNEKEDAQLVSSVEKEVKNLSKEIEDIEKATNETREADEIEPDAIDPEPADDSLPTKKVTEGDLVSFPNLKAVDPDGDPITYTFTSPLNEKGEWQTKEGDAGQYAVTITASDGKNTVSQGVKLIVEAKNRAPVITLSTPKEITVNEGETVKIDAQAADPDNDPVTITFSGWMEGPTRTTTYEDAGKYTVTIKASDGKKEAVEEVAVTVSNVNRAPKLGDLVDLKVTEGDEIKVDAEAADPDGDEVTITFSTPLGAQDGIWKTKQGDAGTYEVEATAKDGALEDKKTFKIIVQSLNKAPVIELASPTITVNEGETVSINAKITDPENDELTITYAGWMTSNTYTTDYDDAGTHTVTITVTDKINKVEQEVTINVLDMNRPPVFDPGAFN